jgi:hypothetical protein
MDTSITELTIQHISMSLLTCNVGGNTFFTLFHNRKDILELAYQKVVEYNFINESKQDIFTRQILHTLNCPFDSETSVMISENYTRANSSYQ